MAADTVTHDRLTRGRGAGLAAAVFGTAVGFWLTGGGWIAMFVAGAVFAAGGLDYVVARRTATRAQVAIVRAPSDATVGDSVTFVLSVLGSSGDLVVGDHSGAFHNIQVSPPARAGLRWTASRRGVFGHLDLSVTSAGLSAIVGYTASRRVQLPTPVFVGPQPVDPHEPLPQIAAVASDGAARPSASGDIVRGVRPYVQGDSLRRVHWPATARAGELVVMEVEEPAAPVLYVVLDLGEGGPAGEQAAGRAAWYATEAMRREYVVRLSTLEVGGPVQGEVSSASDLNRRLAAAVAGPVRTAAGGVRPVVEVGEAGDRWVL